MSDLESWTAAGSGTLEEISVVDNGDGTVTVRDTVPIPATGIIRRFLRMKIVKVTG